MEHMEFSAAALTTLDSWRARRAEVFGKWLWVYFWMQIIPLIPAVIAVICEINETPLPFVELLNYLLSGVCIWILYKLGAQEDRFKTCAGLSLILLVAGAAIGLLDSEVTANLWSIPGGILELVVTYQFMMGCAEILATTDTELSEKWRKLWTWNVGLLIGSIVLFPLLLVLYVAVDNILIALLTLILVLGFAIALPAVAIAQMVYLYRTARLFRGMAKTMNWSADGTVGEMD